MNCNKCIVSGYVLPEEKQTEIEMGTEVSMPDYCPEINRIVKCKAEAFVNTKAVMGEMLNIGGYVHITILYTDQNNCIYSYYTTILYYNQV